MMAINLQTSFLTPPFGFALFYLRAVAPKSIKTSDIYKGVIPFVIIQIVVLALLAAFPIIVTWLPDAFYDTNFSTTITGMLEFIESGGSELLNYDPENAPSWVIDF